jgi:hypothetical protein
MTAQGAGARPLVLPAQAGIQQSPAPDIDGRRPRLITGPCDYWIVRLRGR